MSTPAPLAGVSSFWRVSRVQVTSAREISRSWGEKQIPLRDRAALRNDKWFLGKLGSRSCLDSYRFFVARGIVGRHIFVQNLNEVRHDLVALEGREEASIDVNRGFGLFEGSRK
jgi:hypothetical protein